MTGEGDEGKCSSASQYLMLVSRHSVVTLLIKNLDGPTRSGRLGVEAAGGDKAHEREPDQSFNNYNVITLASTVGLYSI